MNHRESILWGEIDRWMVVTMTATKSAHVFGEIKRSSLIVDLNEELGSFAGSKVYDVGCGEGKNAAYLAPNGADVDAADISKIAIEKATSLWADQIRITWQVRDVREEDLPEMVFDIVVAYGLFHCYRNPLEIASVVEKLKSSTVVGGYNVVCVFNDRFQDLRGHPGFSPCLILHNRYLEHYQDLDVRFASDANLDEVHPHNMIPHTHSMTRLIAKRVRE